MLVPVLTTEVGGKTSLCCKVKEWAEGIAPDTKIYKTQSLPLSSLISRQFQMTLTCTKCNWSIKNLE